MIPIEHAEQDEDIRHAGDEVGSTVIDLRDAPHGGTATVVPSPTPYGGCLDDLARHPAWETRWTAG